MDIYGTQFNDNDTKNAGKFRPSLVGTDQVDSIYGKAGHDKLYGQGNNDKLYGGIGNDKLYGQAGHDNLEGGIGHDNLDGGTGHDNLYGGTGHDKLYGQSGNDDLDGEAGNDFLTGGSGNDTLNGFDSLNPSSTEFDTLTGGANADKFVLGAQANYNFYTGDGFALITDFKSSEGDKIALFETFDKYKLQSGNFGYGNPNVQDTKILFGNDVIGVLQDITKVKATDFMLGDPFPQ